MRDVAAELDVAEEAEARVRGGLREAPCDRLDLLVVRRDAGAHEPVRRRQAVEHVDPDIESWLAQQLFGRVKRRRARPR